MLPPTLHFLQSNRSVFRASFLVDQTLEVFRNVTGNLVLPVLEPEQEEHPIRGVLFPLGASNFRRPLEKFEPVLLAEPRKGFTRGIEHLDKETQNNHFA